MSKKILFITPPYHCGVVESAGRWPNLGLLYVAGELRKDGHEVEVYDAMAKNHGWPEIEERIRSSQPEVVGSTAYTATMPDATELLRLAKSINPEIVTLVGGVHPTMMPEETLHNGNGAIDYIVRWEGEYTTPELLRAIEGQLPLSSVRGIAYRENGQVVTTPKREYIPDLDILSPAWDLLDWSDYYLFYMDDSRVACVSSSRGCINGCAFCSQHRFWEKTFRGRRPESFVAELEDLHSRFGVNVFFVGDEFPTKDPDRWEQILDLLIEKDLGIYLLVETCAADIVRDREILPKYRRAGIIHMYIGVEAATQETLDMFKKTQTCEECRESIRLLNEQGIITECSFILGLPDETPESIRNTIELAKYYNADNPHFLMISPWPYADMYEELKPFIDDWDYRKYNLVEPVIKPRNMTRDDVFKAVLNCYKNYYINKLPEWDAMEDEFKKELLFRGLKAIMDNSFLKEHMGTMGDMPAEVKKYVNRF
ncbi:B12-binding domain-containing radical SAM protein [Thermodesulfobacteriota bacterium]